MPPTTSATPATAPGFFRKALGQKRFTFGFVVTLLIVAFAIIAPFVAPYGENETAGPPYSKDGSSAPTTSARTCSAG